MGVPWLSDRTGFATESCGQTIRATLTLMDYNISCLLFVLLFCIVFLTALFYDCSPSRVIGLRLAALQIEIIVQAGMPAVILPKWIFGDGDLCLGYILTSILQYALYGVTCKRKKKIWSVKLVQNYLLIATKHQNIAWKTFNIWSTKQPTMTMSLTKSPHLQNVSSLYSPLKA